MIIKDKINRVRTDLKTGNQIVVISSDTRPGALVGMDRVYYQIAYPDTSVIYGLYPIREPDPANLAPLNDGELNCVAQRVIEHFEGSLRGQGLTPARRQKIQDWEEKVRETGAKVDDVAELEKILKRPIILKDIAGEDIFNSRKYGRHRHRSIELIAHNGHTFSNKLRFPRAREIHIYVGDISQAITRAIEGQPIAVWLLGGESDMGFNIDQLVLQDGQAFKTKEMFDKLKKACADLENEDLADKVFSINHAASIMARNKNGWKPTPASILETVQMACVEHGHGGLWNGKYDVNDVICIDILPVSRVWGRLRHILRGLDILDLKWHVWP